MGSNDGSLTASAEFINTSTTLMARDYKGFNNYGSNGTINVKHIGSTHWDHGWCESKADFSGIAPTIDAGISMQHSMLIEKGRVNNGN